MEPRLHSKVIAANGSSSILASPDVCPTTMMEIAGALKALGPRADAVQAIFISVDPQRDTPKVLNEYLKSFDPRLIGLTGTPTQIAAAAKAFHVFYERSLANLTSGLTR